MNKKKKKTKPDPHVKEYLKNAGELLTTAAESNDAKLMWAVLIHLNDCHESYIHPAYHAAYN
jgi:hypothetical protein